MKKNQEYVMTAQDEIDIERAIDADPGPRPNDAIAIRYSKASDGFVLTLRSGLVFHIPKGMIGELHDIPSGSVTLSRVVILGPGTGIAWDDVDVAIKTSTLIATVLSGGNSPVATDKRKGGRHKKKV